MKLSLAMDGFLLSLRADGYSNSTINLYQYVLDILGDYLKDPEVNKITPTDLTRYFAYLRTDYKAHNNQGRLSGGSLQNHWKAIRCFFNWAGQDLRLRKRPDDKLKLPPNNPKAIMPLLEEEVKALLAAAEFTQEVRPGNRQPFKMRRRTRDRDVAVIITLLDTGMRVGELGRLNIKDVDLETGNIYISPFGSSRRKTKSRVVPIGKAARRAIWHYLAGREDTQSEDPLFISELGNRVDADSVRHLLVDLGNKAGVKNLHPHRLRHTFAVEYLRNGGDIFTLQMILGHASLDMVKVYLQLAQLDTKNAHMRASPADHWKV
jgi:integrase/recombinase XerD